MVDNNILKIIKEGLEDKLARDIRCLDVSDFSIMSDYLVICHGANYNQINAIARNIEDVLRENNIPMKNKEGYYKDGWLLLDYYDIIIHVFSAELREYYDLEHVYFDAKRIY